MNIQWGFYNNIKNFFNIALKNYHIHSGLGVKFTFDTRQSLEASDYQKKIMMNNFEKRDSKIDSKDLNITINNDFEKFLNNNASKIVLNGDNIIIYLPKSNLNIHQTSLMGVDNEKFTIKKEKGSIINIYQNINKKINSKENNPIISREGYNIINNASLKSQDDFLFLQSENFPNNIKIPNNNLNLLLSKTQYIDPEKAQRFLYPTTEYFSENLKKYGSLIINDDIDTKDLLNLINNLNFIKFLDTSFNLNADNFHISNDKEEYIILSLNQYQEFFKDQSSVNKLWFGENHTESILKQDKPQEYNLYFQELFGKIKEFKDLNSIDKNMVQQLKNLNIKYNEILYFYCCWSFDTNFTVINKKIGLLGLDTIFSCNYKSLTPMKNFINEDFSMSFIAIIILRVLIYRYKNFKYWIGLCFNYHLTSYDPSIRRSYINNPTTVDKIIDNQMALKKNPQIPHVNFEDIIKKNNNFQKILLCNIFYIGPIKILLFINPIQLIFHKMINIHFAIGYTWFYKNFKNEKLEIIQQLIEKENNIYLNKMNLTENNQKHFFIPGLFQ